MTKRNKIIIISTVSVIIVFLGVFSLVSGFANKETIDISGILEAKNTQIPSLVSGVVEEVKSEEGDEVKKGETIIKLDTKQLEIKRDQAESYVKQAEAQLEMVQEGASTDEIKQLQAKVNQARANLQSVSSGARPEEITQASAKVDSAQIIYDKAEKEFESAKKLYDQDIITKNKLDEIEVAYNNAKATMTTAKESLKMLKKGATSGQLNMAKQMVAESSAALSQAVKGARPAQIKVAEAQVDQAKSELKSIDQMIDDSSIKAPISGTVSEIVLNPGELVTKGASIANIIDLDHLWVKVFVPESRLVYLKQGQTAKIIPEALDKIVFPGKVTYIAQKGAFIPPGTKESVDQQVFEVHVSLNKSTLGDIQLRPGMSVKVKIDISNKSKKSKET